MQVFITVLLATLIFGACEGINGAESGSALSLQQLQLQVVDLVMAQSKQNEQIERLEKKVQMLAVRNEDLTKNLNTVENQLNKERAAIQLISHHSKQLVTELPPAQDLHVAFSVALSSSQTPTSHQRAPFDLVFANYGDAYDVTTYEFTAPVAGFYLFIVSVTTFAENVASLRLYHNEALEMYVNDRDNTASSHTSGANSLILQLQEGDRVYVDMHGTSDRPWLYHGNPSSCDTSFTGVLLFTLPTHQVIEVDPKSDKV